MEEKELDNKEKLASVLFMNLVMGLQGSAWMLLGKVANPMTGQITRDLEGAKATIDMLDMLKTKTKGNLMKSEEDFITIAIQQLQINYVEEAAKPEDAHSHAHSGCGCDCQDHSCEDPECECEEKEKKEEVKKEEVKTEPTQEKKSVNGKKQH